MAKNHGVSENAGEARRAHHSRETKTNIIHRLNRIEGQIRGVSRMVAEDLYCDDVLHQILSIEAALNGVRRQLLEAHIRGCVVDQIESGRYEVIDELMATIGKMNG